MDASKCFLCVVYQSEENMVIKRIKVGTMESLKKKKGVLREKEKKR